MGLPGSATRAARRQAELDEQAAVEAELKRIRVAERVAERIAGTVTPTRRTSPTAAVRRVAWRGRRVLAPFPVLAVLLVAAGRIAGPDGPGAFTTFATAALCAACWWALRGRRLPPGHVRYAASCLAGAAIWLTWTAATRLEVTALWGVLAWIAGSTPWWWRHWPSDRLPDVEDLPAPSKPSIPELWAENIAAEGGAAPKSVLYAPSLTKNGRAYLVQLDPGKQDIADLRGKLSKLSTGLRTPMERIVVDDDTGSEDPSIVRLQIIDKSPIRKTLWFAGPRWAKGLLHLGLHADGDGAAQYRLYTDDGSMWGGFVLGGTGSGKSRLLEAIAVTVRAMSADGMPTSIIYLDGQSGASSAAIADNATWFRGRDGGETVLRALERAVVRRNAWNRLHRMMKFFPGHKPEGAEYGLPGILVIVEECHRIFTTENAQRWSNIAREGRKLGIAILAASQHVGLATFGGSEELRSSLFTGNLIVMRTKSATAVNMLGELGGVDPTTFPKLPGYGYKIAEDGDDERSVPFRGDYLPDGDDAEKYLQRHGEPVPVPTVDEWFARTADAEVDEMTADAFGPVFVARAEIDEKLREKSFALIEGREDSTLTVVDPVEPPPTDTPRLVPVADLDEELPEDEEQASTTRQLILQLLAQGSRTKKELEALSGKSDSSVKQALRGLVEDGLIERLNRGVYALANASAAV